MAMHQQAMLEEQQKLQQRQQQIMIQQQQQQTLKGTFSSSQLDLLASPISDPKSPAHPQQKSQIHGESSTGAPEEEITSGAGFL